MKRIGVTGGNEVRIEGRLVRIAHIDGEKYTAPGNLEALLAELKACGERIDLFTFLQHPPETEVLYPYYHEWDNLAIMPITTFDNWWNHQIKSIGRNRARQAEKKGLVIREIPYDDNLLRGIVEIHNESPVRQGRRFPHYGMTLEGARAYAGTFLDRSFFIGALDGDKIIGFMKLCISESGKHACAINILAMLRHRDKAPTNAMIAQAVRSCAARGISYLVYENFTYGKKSSDSLSQFKEANGFRRMDLPRYYIPLTPVGKFVLRAGLHHRWVDYIPEFLMGRYRKLRAAYYSNRYRDLEGNVRKG